MTIEEVEKQKPFKLTQKSFLEIVEFEGGQPRRNAIQQVLKFANDKKIPVDFGKDKNNLLRLTVGHALIFWENGNVGVETDFAINLEGLEENKAFASAFKNKLSSLSIFKNCNEYNHLGGAISLGKIEDLSDEEFKAFLELIEQGNNTT
ncbi:hypothetical protein CH333_03070 [candidate division WOR-3 bacterium JGI_Cruoil_03_44_89]|uniref:Uncharacterized protein n=1 Tax=candidate division WOR-3 bacterium JGI_Cruoil_03_44_89 TaxID=1973748 RepID=A0A235BXQ6_UNCW3|nr:MAG: hypothetical protein CH333_03070 [candidate division WOR-3 bacterium JGI_Cruoil_03_44_89]